MNTSAPPVKGFLEHSTPTGYVLGVAPLNVSDCCSVGITESRGAGFL